MFILVCPNGTKIGRQTPDEVFMAKINFESTDFALTRAVIDDHENAYSFKSVVSFHTDFEQS